VLSRFINRHPDSYRDAEYLQLREEIKAAGGNTQPIGVRPLAGTPGKYELSFGSRRRQACLDVGLPVLAMIDEMDDLVLFERMERENRQRKNLRPYEQGLLYQQALDAKLYSSVRKLAESLQIDAGGLTRLLAVARLPVEVVAAFQTPLDIQAKLGPLLADALTRNPDAVLAKAGELKGKSPRASAQAVVEQLLATAASAERPSRSSSVEISGPAGLTAWLSFRGKAATVAFKNLPPEKRAGLEKVIRKYLAE
jgi:ParB family chromosome partitioning protein